MRTHPADLSHFSLDSNLRLTRQARARPVRNTVCSFAFDLVSEREKPIVTDQVVSQLP